MTKAPKPTKLHDVEQWYQTPIAKHVLENATQALTKGVHTIVMTDAPKPKLVATLHRGKPYPLAKALKRQEELKNYPKGTYFKIIPHP